MSIPESGKTGSFPKKEYSIQQFHIDYEKIFSSKVLPILTKYENERKIRLTVSLFVIGCLFLYCAVWYIQNLQTILKGNENAGYGFFILLVSLVISIPLWIVNKKTFENKIKKKVMPILMRAIPNFYWQQTPPVKSNDILSAMLFPTVEYICQYMAPLSSSFISKTSNFMYDDCFVGWYKNVNVDISETTYTVEGRVYRLIGKSSEKMTRVFFRGVVIRFKMNKRFTGTTVIRPKNINKDDEFKDLKNMGLQHVILEDEKFNNKYDVYSTDQIEARYLLTTAFMERFKNLILAFNAQGVYCSFYDNYIYIAPFVDKDLFSIASLTTSLTNNMPFEILFKEFTSILALVDHFKLDKKLGL